MNNDIRELNINELDTVSGCGLVPVVTGLKHSPSLTRPTASGSSGDGDTQLGNDYGGDSAGGSGSGGYRGDGNYLRPF